MSIPQFDIVIPLYRVRWNTQAVVEGLTHHYQPRSLHIITPETEARSLQEMLPNWQTAPLFIHAEERFFKDQLGFTKDLICAELDLGESLYTPGWFYQQLLKLGAYEGIPSLSEWYLVWDSDLLPVATWPVIDELGQHKFALIQHNGWGNPAIVSKWAHWIRTVLAVEPLTDPVGTFIPHHMWFKQDYLQSFAQRLGQYFDSTTHWLLLMMRSANEFGTFSEYWSYVSWVAAQSQGAIAFYPYAQYGETTERFFDDGTGLFSAALRSFLGLAAQSQDDFFSPTYEQVSAFIQQEYGAGNLPSSLAFESSPRHLKKDEKNMHIEESRSRWNPRMVKA